jgi:hypothetical protein
MRSSGSAFVIGGCIDRGRPMPSHGEIRDAQRETWAGLSEGWEKWDSVIMDQLARCIVGTK